MVAYSEPGQRITRLTPLADALAAVEAHAQPVASRQVDIAVALGRTLAADVVAGGPQPSVALALRDGWAVRSQDTIDASSYAPAPLSAAPVRVAMGEPLPPGADAVAPEEAMLCRDGIAEALAPLAPGDGVLMPAADAQAGRTLCQAGRRLRAIDRAVLQAAGIRQVAIREPRVRLICAGVPGAAIASAYEWLGRLLANEGAAVIANESGVVANDDPRQARDLAAAFRDERSDAIFVLGGTGAGSTDVSVVTLARLGRVAFHGVALVPGQTAAFGLAGNRPVLFFPGRLDAAVAVWLAIGRRLLAGLAGGRVEEAVIMAQLSRKIASSPGMAEVVPVRRSGNAAEPLASGYLSLSSLARADGWILVPAHSEGFPAGAQVAVSPFA